ncbi:MAG: DEAD/DEAH box helicase [Planctomycetaceae bacterium]|jgi:superfamily II DNA or RNA helicase|nr:DEAD/DEAH box helicase [Planctomycetaceae bacterium]
MTTKKIPAKSIVKTNKANKVSRNSSTKQKIKHTEKLTLYDRLSHLTYRQACDILGVEGALLLRRHYPLDNLDIKNDVYLGEDLFRLSIREPSSTPITVTIMLADKAKHKLAACCSLCNPTKEPNRYCEHVVATISFLLEEKSLIGLAEIPDLETPPELLSPKQLLQRALHEREQRAKTENFKIKTTDNKTPWTDYIIVSEISGKTYRVALRSTEHGDSYCSCPDFKTNRLGTCKHILHLLHRCKKKFDEKTLGKPYANKETIVYLKYGEHRTLHLALPDDVNKNIYETCIEAKKIAKPFLDRPINNVKELLKAVSKLESLDFPVTIYPDADQWIQEQIFKDRMKSLVEEIRANPKEHPLRKNLLKVELLPYQLDGIAFVVGTGRAILADDMGLGKTIQGIGVAELLAREIDIKKVLIICPASVKSQWKSEIAKFAPHRTAQLVLGGSSERFDQYGNNTFFTICNYEQVIRDMLPIEQTRWDLIILDEGQRIKNWEAKTARAVKALSSPYALILSGTPMENRIDELYSVVQFVDDRRLLPAYRFFHRHRIVEDSGRVAGYKNLDELREQLKPILLRRTKESVQIDLPERTVEVVRIAPTEEQLSMHAGHMQTVAGIVGKKYLTEMDLLRLQKALLAARMSADSTYLVDKQEPSYSSKLDRLFELLEELLSEYDRKIVLFSEWTTMLNLIEPIFEQYKTRYVRLDGSVPQKKRQLFVREFTEEPECRVFLTTNAGSVGLNLQAANTVVNVDLPWNPAILEQRIGRAHRMGQQRHVQVFLLVTENTIEEQMLQTISAKHDLALASLDADSEVNEVMLTSGVEELKRRLEILLGSRPAAPVDQSMLQSLNTSPSDATITQITQPQDQEPIIQAGGEALQSLFRFADTLLGTLSTKPDTLAAATAAVNNTINTTNISEQILPAIQKAVAQSVRVESDDEGKTRLSFTLPERPVLEGLLQNAAQLLNSFITPKQE